MLLNFSSLLTGYSLTLLAGLGGVLASPLGALDKRVEAGAVLWERQGTATAYYDLGPSDLCGRTPGNEGAPFPANWSNATGMNTSPTKCEFKMSGGIGPTLGQLGTNRIVAMGADVMNGDLSAYCGKEVKIFKNGVQFTIDEGPFILWDTCDACVGAGPAIDVSAKAFVGLSPGGLCRDNIAGIKAQVVANQIWQPATGDDWTPAKTGPMWWPPGNGPPPPVNPIPSTPVVPAVSVPVVPVPQASTTVVANPGGAPAGDACTVKGQWLCKGLALMQCDAVTSTTFAYKTINPGCATYCDVKRQPICG